MRQKKPSILWTLFQLYLVWRQRPQLRLGQLIECAVENHQLFYIRDETLIKKLRARF